jgi:hypothetical protein
MAERTLAELRRRSISLLAHARQLREKADAARVRSAQHRARSQKALASLREKRRLLAAVMNRRSFLFGATSRHPS